MRNIFIACCLFACVYGHAQNCEPCGERTLINFQKIEWLGIQKPEDSVLLEQWNKLEDLWKLITQRCEQSLQKGSCTYINPSVRNTSNSPVAKNNKYTIYGTIVHFSSEYVLRLFMHPACSNENIAEEEIRFQMYPFFDIDKIATEAANRMWNMMLNTYDYEMKQRKSMKYGLGGDLSGGSIEISIDKKMAKGEETMVKVQVADCDGFLLPDKEISTRGTIGGTFTPAQFKTGADGIATVKFKMMTDKTAIVKASCETKNVWGCQDLYTGSEVVSGIAGTPVKVSIDFDQYETRTMQRITLPGIEIQGGEEMETIDMHHHTLLYYFPSKKNLDDGLLVDVKKEGYYLGLTEDVPSPGTTTIFADETGYFSFKESVQNAKIKGMVGNVEMVRAEEAGEETSYFGAATLKNPSQVAFTLGNQYEPPAFMWNVEYPASDGNIAGGSAIIVKGDSGVNWVVNKITDPKSPYKTEYLFSQTIDFEEELKKGDSAMAALFGFNSEMLAKTLDPTKPSQSPFGAGGSQTITIRILSPYEDLTYKPKK